jgi:hypothetical protein
MGKANNRLGITTRFNRSELELVIAGMSTLGIKNIKDYVKFSSLKLADIVIQQRKQQQEAANETVQSNATPDIEANVAPSDSGEQVSASV